MRTRRTGALGQLRPANTTAASLYSRSRETVVGVLRSLFVCNTTASAAKYRVFYAEDGSTFDETTALFYDVEIPANSTDTINLADKGADLTFGDTAIGVRTDTNDALNFTLFGEERSL